MAPARRHARGGGDDADGRIRPHRRWQHVADARHAFGTGQRVAQPAAALDAALQRAGSVRRPRTRRGGGRSARRSRCCPARPARPCCRCPAQQARTAGQHVEGLDAVAAFLGVQAVAVVAQAGDQNTVSPVRRARAFIFTTRGAVGCGAVQCAQAQCHRRRAEVVALAGGFALHRPALSRKRTMRCAVVRSMPASAAVSGSARPVPLCAASNSSKVKTRARLCTPGRAGRAGRGWRSSGCVMVT